MILYNILRPLMLLVKYQWLFIIKDEIYIDFESNLISETNISQCYRNSVKYPLKQDFLLVT